MRLAILSSHPIQYYAPLFRRLADLVDLHVFFAHRATPDDQARAGFGQPFDWDIDLTKGYCHTFLENVSKSPGLHHFSGCDTPSLKSSLSEGQFDAVLLLGWHFKAYLQGLWAGKNIGIPVLVRGDSHLDTFRSPLKRMVKSLTYPKFLRWFDAALYVGQRSRAYYEFYGYPPQRLFYSPHCVDTEWFSARANEEVRAQLRTSLGVGPGTMLLLFAGKLLPSKRPQDLIAAAALGRINGQSLEVIVAGDGEMRDTLAMLAQGAGVPLHLLGFRNQVEMPGTYATSDCLVVPSESETWGLVANEALACGRPIIVSEACGCSSDLAADGKAGRVFNTGNVRALAHAIQAIMSSPPRTEAIASVSRAHSVDAAANGVMSALDYLMASRSRN
jgi:glycosyltransferase involved in cell wall biosynthesis